MVNSTEFIKPLSRPIDSFFANQPPWMIVAKTIVTLITLSYLKKVVIDRDWKRVCARFIRTRVAKLINKENDNYRIKREEKQFSGQDPIPSSLPLVGLSVQEVINLVSRFNKKHFEKGHSTGTVYHLRSSIFQVCNKAIETHLPANPMHADVFEEVRRFEASIISQTRTLFNGDDSVRGYVTSGGTESNILALLSARRRAEDLYDIKSPNRIPEVVIPSTAHISFARAAEYLGMKLVTVDIDPITFKADPKKMEAAITRNTVMIVGSAPCYPYGTIDPIEELSKIVQKHNGKIGLHVDCCLGAFLVNYTHEFSYFDFRSPGVTSISCDTHKFGCGPKGGSVILYRSQEEWAKYQISAAPGWVAGAYGSTTLTGSRPGFISAGTWAVMQHVGAVEYKRNAFEITLLARKLANKIQEIEELELLMNPQTCVVTFRFKNNCYNTHALGDYFKNRGWFITDLQRPSGIHFCITLVHVDQQGFIDRFIKDLRESIFDVRTNTEAETSSMTLYGSMEKIPVGASWLTPYLFGPSIQTYFMVVNQHKPEVWNPNTTNSSSGTK